MARIVDAAPGNRDHYDCREKEAAFALERYDVFAASSLDLGSLYLGEVCNRVIDQHPWCRHCRILSIKIRKDFRITRPSLLKVSADGLALAIILGAVTFLQSRSVSVFLLTPVAVVGTLDLDGPGRGLIVSALCRRTQYRLHVAAAIVLKDMAPTNRKRLAEAVPLDTEFLGRPHFHMRPI
jgi:hypothetical protein